MTQVSVSEASRNLSHWINRASYGRECIVITSRGKAKAVIVGIDAFEELIGIQEYAEKETLPLEQLQEEFRETLAEGGYRTRDDIVHLVREVKQELASGDDVYGISGEHDE